MIHIKALQPGFMDGQRQVDKQRCRNESMRRRVLVNAQVFTVVNTTLIDTRENVEFGVSPSQALLFAQFALAANTPGTFQGALLANKPDILFDPTSGPLLYQFYVYTRFNCVGVIRIAADKRLQTPVIAIQSVRATQPDFAALIRLALPKAEGRRPDYRPVDAYPVIYAYPKTGVQVVMVPASEPDGSRLVERVIVDIDTLAVVEEVPEGGPAVDGHQAYSLLALAGRGRSARADIQRTMRAVEQWEKTRQAMEAALAAYGGVEGGPPVPPAATDTHVLAARYGAAEGEFPLISQVDTYNCALASAEMIIQYLTGRTIDQGTLAGPFQKGPFGTSNEGQINGYRTVLADASFVPEPIDTTPTPDESAAAIDAGTPMKSGVPQHARACCGYRRNHVGSKDEDLTSFELLIHDPWPPNEGRVYWEYWNSILHTNFLFLKQGAVT